MDFHNSPSKNNDSWSWFFFFIPFQHLVNMATRSLVDGNTELTAKGITSIYMLTRICEAIRDANGQQELIKKFPTLITPFKHSDEVRHTAKLYITTTGPPTHASARRLHPEKYKIAKDEFQHMLQLGIQLSEARTTESIIHRTQSEERCNVLLPTTGTRHVVAKGHKPLPKTHVST